MDLRPDRDDHPTAETTAAHAPAWTAAIPAAAATAPHAPIWTGAEPAVAEATAAHLPIWTDATPVPQAAEQSEESVDHAEVPTFQLSMTAVAGERRSGRLCARILGSQLGVAGTLLGAALGSVVSMTAAPSSTIHCASPATNCIARSSPAARSCSRPALAGVGGSAPARHEHVATTRLASASAHDRSASSVSTPIHRASTGAAELPRARPAGLGPDPRPRPPRFRLGATGCDSATTSIERPPAVGATVWALAGGTLAGFALAIVALTGYEMISGTPVSGGDQGGLSVLGGGTTGTPDTDARRRPGAERRSRHLLVQLVDCR